MDWKTLPGFEEKYAKVSVKTHKTFDHFFRWKLFRLFIHCELTQVF